MKYLFSNSEGYLKYTSFQQKSRSINEVLLKYKQSTFLFVSAFMLHLYFLLGSSLKAYFYWTSRIWSINEVYTSHIVFLFIFVKRMVIMDSIIFLWKLKSIKNFTNRNLNSTYLFSDCGLLEIGKNMEKLTGYEKVFHFD